MNAENLANFSLTWEDDYRWLIERVISTGFFSPSRAGDTYSLPGESIRIPLTNGFPLLLSRKMFTKGIFGELAGFVRGATLLKTYKDFGCNYWDANAANWIQNKGKPESEWHIGRSYGALWRNFNGQDQLVNLVRGLKEDPLSRRHVVTAWDPSAEACLPSCHILWQCYVRDNRLSIVVYMRSVDLCVGLPSDIALYAMLANLIARDTGLCVGELVFQFGDCHVYDSHVSTYNEVHKGRFTADKDYPTLELATSATLFNFTPQMVSLLNYNPLPAINYPFNA